jgi:hypothetical protein
VLSEFEFAFESAFAFPFAIHHGAGAKCAGSHCINLTFPFNLRYNTHAADLTSALTTLFYFPTAMCTVDLIVHLLCLSAHSCSPI